MSASLSHNACAQVTPDTATSGLLNSLGQRAYQLAIDDRCHIFATPVTMALRSGFLTTRNQAISQGLDSEHISQITEEARQQQAHIACEAYKNSSEATQLAQSYLAFASQPRTEFKFAQTQWTVVRTYGDNQVWRMVQYVKQDGATIGFGLYGTLRAKRLRVLAQFGSDQHPYSAHLIVRNSHSTAYGKTWLSVFVFVFVSINRRKD